MPENNQTLLDRVTESLEAARAGTLKRSQAEAVLADMQTYLQAAQATGEDQLAPDTIDRIATAIDSLSFSERESLQHVFNELGGNEGTLVASKIADANGVTRSVIVNGLRKLESAGLVKTKSLGMKGTWIRIMALELRQRLQAAG